MVFAMHHIQLLTIVRHLERDSWFESYLHRQVAEGRLIASVTSEVGTGGDMARSIAAVTPAEDGLVSFEKQAPTVSYGAYADDLLTTLRRAPGIRARRPGGRRSPTQTSTRWSRPGTWDVLGMRGTCSPGSVVRAQLRRRAGAGDPVCQGRRRVDGPDLPHPVVAPVARDRRGRVRPGAGLRQGRGQAHPGSHAARRAAPVAALGRGGAAARPGQPRACATSRPTPRDRPASSSRR